MLVGIEQISLNIANIIGTKLNKTREEVAVLNYGLFVILHTTITMLAMLIVGILTNSVKEIIIICLSSALLKKYSGGVHASSPIRCLIVGVSMCLIFTLTCNVFVEKLRPTTFLLVLVIGIVISYIVLYRRSPIGSKQKPLKKESKRKLLRKKSFLVMNMYSLAIVVLYSIYNINGSYYIKSICLSILLGALIQIFALSEIGERIITGIDKTLDRGHQK